MRARHLHSVPVDGFAQQKLDDDGGRICRDLGERAGSLNSAMHREFIPQPIPDTITPMESHGLRSHEEFDALRRCRSSAVNFGELTKAQKAAISKSLWDAARAPKYPWPRFVFATPTRWQRFKSWLRSVLDRMTDDSEPL